MTFKVQITRYFEEFGCTDTDLVEFDDLKDAYEFYNNNIDDKNLKLYAGNDRIA